MWYIQLQSRPPIPKYTVTWNVGAVTSYLKDLGHNDKLSLKELSGKLVMLMALVEASRSSELATLDLRFRSFGAEGVTFKLLTLTKKRNPGAPPRELFFAALGKGVPIQEILQTADWSRESTFKKYYYRPSKARPGATFAQKVLFSFLDNIYIH